MNTPVDESTRLLRIVVRLLSLQLVAGEAPRPDRVRTQLDKIKLLSSAGTGHFYVTTKNKRLHPDKLEVKKYDPVARKHVSYKETKIK